MVFCGSVWWDEHSVTQCGRTPESLQTSFIEIQGSTECLEVGFSKVLDLKTTAGVAGVCLKM